MVCMRRHFGAVLFWMVAGWFALSVDAPCQLGKRAAKDYIPILENPERVARLKPNEVVARLNLKKTNVVADVGAGSGVFTRRLAEALAPGGKVYAVDIDPELLEYNRSKIEEAKLTNVEFVLSDYDDPKLPTETIDLVFLCDALHHIEHRQVYLNKLRSCLRSDGKVAIIDYRTNWPPGHEQMKYNVEELMDWMKKAGFKKVRGFDLISDAFFLLFEKRGNH